MGTIALLPCDPISRGQYLDGKELPANYMADFTLLGMVVDRYQDAVALLVSAGYRLEMQKGGADIRITTPRQLAQLKTFLTANSIRCELSDIADTLYQA